MSNGMLDGLIDLCEFVEMEGSDLVVWHVRTQLHNFHNDGLVRVCPTCKHLLVIGHLSHIADIDEALGDGNLTRPSIQFNHFVLFLSLSGGGGGGGLHFFLFKTPVFHVLFCFENSNKPTIK